MSPGTVRRQADPLAAEATALFDRLAGRDEVDGIGDVAIPYPLAVFPDIVGVPAEGREHLLPYGELVFNGFGPRNRLFAEAMAGAAPVQDWVASTCRAENLAPGGMGAQLHGYAAEDGFTPDQSALLMRSLLSAGLDTTVHAIGNALWCLAANPDQYALLRADPARAGAAFEEALRYESAVQTFFRTTTRPVVVGDVEIPAGEKVLLFLGAANRDHRRWPDPDRFDIARKASGHVAFGAGIHACVGGALARAEGSAVLAELARRYATVTLSAPPEPQLNNTLRALRSLPLAVTP